jgi:hypothetical protein
VKGRPRSIEREVAHWITRLSAPKGYAPVHRIPVLGRAGPDLTINEFGLVIDVKSRLSVPESVFVNLHGMIALAGLVGVRLDDLGLLLDPTIKPWYFPKPSIVVQRWFNHMDEWRREYRYGDVTCLVLHRPGRHVNTSTLIVAADERYKLYDR